MENEEGTMTAEQPVEQPAATNGEQPQAMSTALLPPQDRLAYLNTEIAREKQILERLIKERVTCLRQIERAAVHAARQQAGAPVRARKAG